MPPSPSLMMRVSVSCTFSCASAGIRISLPFSPSRTMSLSGLPKKDIAHIFCGSLSSSLLICRAKQYFMEAYRYPKLYDENNPRIDRIGLQGDAMTVEICKDNPMLDTDIKLFADALSRDDEMIAERLHTLANLLNDMGYGHGKK